MHIGGGCSRSVIICVIYLYSINKNDMYLYIYQLFIKLFIALSFYFEHLQVFLGHPVVYIKSQNY